MSFSRNNPISETLNLLNNHVAKSRWGLQIVKQDFPLSKTIMTMGSHKIKMATESNKFM